MEQYTEQRESFQRDFCFSFIFVFVFIFVFFLADMGYATLSPRP